MNSTSTLYRARRTVEKPRLVVNVEQNQATSIEMPAGAAIQGVTGTVWLTQERDAVDHVVVAGTTFCTDRSGRVVLTTIDEPSMVLVWKAAPQIGVPETIGIESTRRLELAAQAARATYLADVVVRAVEWIARAVRAMFGRATRPATSPALPAPVKAPRAAPAFRGFVRSL